LSELEKKKFGGGQWCVIQYAQGLAERGHDVMILPMLPSPLPEWFPKERRFSYLANDDVTMNAVQSLCNIILRLFKYPFKKNKWLFKEAIHSALLNVGYLKPGLFPFEMWRALSLAYVRQHMRPADVTIATSFETALPVALYGSGKKMYFMQHFEPYFYKEKRGGEVSRKEALASYRLGLHMIANSSWLKGMVQKEVPGVKVDLCLNAINHEYFYGEPKVDCRTDEVVLISYGGRNVEWKGFREMAEAVRIAREQLPKTKLRWQVYGDADLPPDNPIAPYEHLGFLQPKALGDAYRRADILLSASWYESFPLFPLEAMACGLPVITTQPGTEDFAKDGETAIIVEPKNPASIAQGIIRLTTDCELRMKIARQGCQVSRRFTWENSVRTMEQIILNALHAL
jgi:glycosyltransferase involved in cell wall biosynthesis